MTTTQTNRFQLDWTKIHRNRDRAQSIKKQSRYVEECFLCGRPMTKQGVASADSVHLHNDGSLYHNDDDGGDINDQGWFVIGPECAKTIPSTHRVAADEA